MTTNQKNTKKTKDIKGISALVSNSGSSALNSYMNTATAARRAGNVHRTDGAFLPRLPRLASIGDDGVDHINVSSHGRTDIGNVFSLGEKMPYFDKLLGVEVAHLRAFNIFMIEGAERPESLFRSRLPARQVQGTYKHMLAFMAQAIRSKLDHYEQLRTLLKELAVPIDWYLINDTGRRLRNDVGVGYVQALLEYQRAMNEPHRPFELWKFLEHDESVRIRKMPEAKREAAAMKVLRDTLGEALDNVHAYAKQRAEKIASGKAAPVAEAEQAPAAAAPQPAIETSEQLDAAFKAGNLGQVVGWGGGKRATAKEALTERTTQAAQEVDLADLSRVADKAGEDVEKDEQDLLKSVAKVAESSGEGAAR